MQIVAEVGLQHCGCLGTAFAFVDAIADAGADVAKFQCHEGDPCNSYRPGMENYFPQDASRECYWSRTGFADFEWARLRNKCHKRGLKFSCSVFSLSGVECMESLVDTFKVPSSKTNDHELLRAVAATGKPVVISTGMSDGEEVENAIDVLERAGCTGHRYPIVLHCTSEYPTPPEHTLMESLPYPLGLSDHSGTIFPGLIAAWKGWEMLEVHVCWSKQQWGPDVSSSLTIDELKQLVAGVRFVERMRASTITKDEIWRELEPVRRVFRGG